MREGAALPYRVFGVSTALNLATTTEEFVLFLLFLKYRHRGCDLIHCGSRNQRVTKAPLKIRIVLITEALRSCLLSVVLWHVDESL